MSELRVCSACLRMQAYVMPVCCGCGGTTFAACTLPCPATVFSHTTVYRAPTPALAGRVPYTVLLVEGTHGGLVLAPWSDPALPAIGDRVTLHEHAGALLARPA